MTQCCLVYEHQTIICNLMSRYNVGLVDMTQCLCSGWDTMMIMITAPHYYLHCRLYQYQQLLTDKCFKPDRPSALCPDNSQLNFIFCLCQYGIKTLANYTFWHKKIHYILQKFRCGRLLHK